MHACVSTYVCVFTYACLYVCISKTSLKKTCPEVPMDTSIAILPPRRNPETAKRLATNPSLSASPGCRKGLRIHRENVLETSVLQLCSLFFSC